MIKENLNNFYWENKFYHTIQNNHTISLKKTIYCNLEAN